MLGKLQISASLICSTELFWLLWFQESHKLVENSYHYLSHINLLHFYKKRSSAEVYFFLLFRVWTVVGIDLLPLTLLLLCVTSVLTIVLHYEWLLVTHNSILVVCIGMFACCVCDSFYVICYLPIVILCYSAISTCISIVDSLYRVIWWLWHKADAMRLKTDQDMNCIFAYYCVCFKFNNFWYFKLI